MVEKTDAVDEVVASGDAAAQEEPTAEQFARLAADKKLADEAKSWRLKTREAEAKFAASEARIVELQKQVEAGSAADKDSVNELTRFQREVAELRSKDKARDERERALEAKSKASAIKSRLATIAAEAKLLEAGDAIDLMKRHAEVDSDDVVVFRVKDADLGEIKVEATEANLRKYGLISGIFFPPVGKPGSGARGVNDGVTPDKAGLIDGIDMERAKTDTQYYAANAAKIKAIRGKLRNTPPPR